MELSGNFFLSLIYFDMKNKCFSAHFHPFFPSLNQNFQRLKIKLNQSKWLHHYIGPGYLKNFFPLISHQMLSLEIAWVKSSLRSFWYTSIQWNWGWRFWAEEMTRKHEMVIWDSLTRWLDVTKGWSNFHAPFYAGRNTVIAFYQQHHCIDSSSPSSGCWEFSVPFWNRHNCYGSIEGPRWPFLVFLSENVLQNRNKDYFPSSSSSPTSSFWPELRGFSFLNK